MSIEKQSESDNILKNTNPEIQQHNASISLDEADSANKLINR